MRLASDAFLIQRSSSLRPPSSLRVLPTRPAAALWPPDAGEIYAGTSGMSTVARARDMQNELSLPGYFRINTMSCTSSRARPLPCVQGHANGMPMQQLSHSTATWVRLSCIRATRSRGHWFFTPAVRPADEMSRHARRVAPSSPNAGPDLGITRLAQIRCCQLSRCGS
jgi:hypothetical protein